MSLTKVTYSMIDGAVANVYAFTPTWGANGSVIVISGSYTVA